MKRVIRWILITLGGLVALAVVVVGALYAISARKLSAKHAAPAETELVIPTDSASIARGAYLLASRPCGQCHGEDLGGKVIADAGPFALLAAPNLTRGRGGPNPPLTDVEWERAIRHGLRRDGTGLIIMPSEVFHGITDQEMAAMIAYMKQAPPVDREVERLKLRIVGRMVLGVGELKTAAQLSPTTAHVASVDTTPGPDYGRYLVSTTGCQVCHGASFSGGPGFGEGGKPPSNLTPTGIGHYTEDDFKRTLRTGERPRGAGALSEDMPWKYYGKMSDGELQSIYLYLKTVPPKQFGQP